MWARRFKKKKRERERMMSLTPDGEGDLRLKISTGEGGDMAGIGALVRLLCVQDDQSRVLDGVAVLDPHPTRVTPKLCQTTKPQVSIFNTHKTSNRPFVKSISSRKGE